MNLVIDRTMQDVERWKTLRDKGWEDMTEAERQEWLGEITTSPSAAKGMYTHNDLNRVESAVESVVEMLKEIGHIQSSLPVKKDWTYTSVIDKEEMTRYLENIKCLRSKITVYPNTPKVPSINENLNYKLANDIEKILVDIADLVTKIPKNWHYAGEIFSGEV